MELRKAADTLIRSQSSPLTICSIPRSVVRWASKSRSTCTQCSRSASSRALSTTARRQSPESSPSTPAASTSEPTSTSSASTTSPASGPAPNAMDSLNSSLGWGVRPRAARPPPGLTNDALEKKLNGGVSTRNLLAAQNANSASDLLRNLQQRRKTAGSNSIDTSAMLTPGTGGLGSSLMERTAEETMVQKAKRKQMRLGPSAGRTINVGTQAVDVGRGFKMLEMMCARNKVRNDANKQRFHERPGLKRKRLGRERWRKNFMEGFKATIQRVNKLKRQGW